MSRPPPLSVLVIDDSAANRRAITHLLDGTKGITVVGRAADGEDGLKQVLRLRPDVITLDLEMPRVDGITFLRLLMATAPTPVVVLSSYAHPADVFKALQLGAYDFVAKPRSGEPSDLALVAAELVEKVRSARLPRRSSGDLPLLPDPGPGAPARGRAGAAARERRPERSRGAPALPARAPAERAARRPAAGERRPERSRGAQTSSGWAPSESAARDPAAGERRPERSRGTQTSSGWVPSESAARHLVAVAASTGGPPAVQRLLEALGGLPVCVLVAQHMPPRFTAAFAARLDQALGFAVAEAHPGARLGPGRVWVAPGGTWLEVVEQRGELVLAVNPPGDDQLHAPSADHLFASVARHLGPRAHGVVLTGMGQDGARGLQAMRAAGATTWAEAEASAVVFGMPAAAIATGAVQHVLPLDELGPALARALAAQTDYHPPAR